MTFPFQRNALTMLSECRGELAIRNPEHICFGDVTAAQCCGLTD